MVVPFGLPGGPPPAATGALRAAFPAIGADDRVLVWGGGVWGWLDPLTPMRAVERLPRDAPRACSGSAAPGSRRRARPAAGAAAVEAARRAGLLGTRVHVNDGLGPVRRARRLARGGRRSASPPTATTLEARYAHRTRVLDYLWAGLPVVATRGDALAELVERDGLGARRRARRRRRLRRGLRAHARTRRATPPASGSRRVAPSLRWERGHRAARRPGARRAAARAGASGAAWCAARRSASTAGRWRRRSGDEGPRAALARVGRRLRRAGLR